MSRSGYTDDGDDDPLVTGRWRAQVNSAIRGKRGQSFLRELATAMDAMPVKELIANELVNAEGQCCTIGVVCKARGVDVSVIDYDDPDEVARAVGIAHQLVLEIEYNNDEFGERYEMVEVPRPANLHPQAYHNGMRIKTICESPAERWTRMRTWVEARLAVDSTPPA